MPRDPLAKELREIAARLNRQADILDGREGGDLLNVAEVAELFGVHRTTVNYWCLKGKLGRRIGRDIFLTRKEVETLKRERGDE